MNNVSVKIRSVNENNVWNAIWKIRVVGLSRCTLNVQFSFNSKLYQQRDRVSMGSLLEPLLADVFAVKLGNGALQNTMGEWPTYCRYVDDIFVLVDHSVSIETLVGKLNQAHGALSFTSDEEWENIFHFPDVKLTKTKNGKLIRRVYRNRTWTDQYTHFASFVSLKRKRNLVRSSASRVRNICSN